VIRFAGSAVGAAWVAIVIRLDDGFLLMFGVCAAVAVMGLAGTFLGPDPSPPASPRP